MSCIEEAKCTLEEWDDVTPADVDAQHERSPQASALLHSWGRLGPNGRKVLQLLADRLVLGHERYGDFDDGRDFTREALEEDLDGIVYRAATLIAKAGK